jgi:hypothetical protein
MGDSLGKAGSDWKLPAAAASPEKGSTWNSPAPVSTCAADAATVATGASTISTTDSTFPRQPESVNMMWQPETANMMRQPETVSMKTHTTASTITASSSSSSNPYKGMSLKLNKTSGVPKAALHSVYGRPPRRKVISQENYHTWHNSGPPHLLKFTSIFCCPLTGECVASGRYGDAALYQMDGNGLLWYNKKTLAEHGAAARAFDCISYRECGDGMIPETIGDETPYALAESPPMSPHVPDNIRQAILQAQHGIRSQAGGSIKMEVDSSIDQVEEAAWFNRPPNDAQTAEDLFG